LTLSGVLVIGNHPKLFKKREKKSKKKSSDFFKIEILLQVCKFSKNVKIFEKFQFFAKMFDKTADCKK
jgi:hypothetical protein